MSCFMPESKKCLCYERKEAMSTDPQIKTRLKLSEAVKLLEENESALIRPDEYLVDLSIYYNYYVKLPPPKTIEVTEERLRIAYANSHGIEGLLNELGFKP